MAGRSARDMLGAGANFLGLGAPDPVSAAAQSGTPPQGQIGTRPLGWRTGAPPRTSLKSIQILPYSATTAVIQGRKQQPTKIVDGDLASRSVVLTAPFVGFSIYIGEQPTIRPDDAFRLPPGLPYEIPLPGGQALYAVTDAPVYLTLNVQVAVLMIGDRERLDE